MIPNILKTLPGGGTQPTVALERLFQLLQKRLDEIEGQGCEVEDIQVILITIKDVFDVYASNGVTWEVIKTFASTIDGV